MSRRLAVLVAGAALAAAFGPAQSASAVCVEAWEAVTGQCSPCTTIGPAYRELRELGVPDLVQCLA